jgi:glycosyltransferase involved in cell wall biosynthesis
MPTQPNTERQPDLTIVLCVHNGADTVTRQLEALAAQTWAGRWDVVIVDNRSTDRTPQVVGDFVARHDRFRVVGANEKLGLSYARNVGVASTTARSVAFCDDDDLVGEGWVAAMGTALRDHEIVASRLDWNLLADTDGVRVGGTFQREQVEEIFGLPAVAGVSGWQKSLWDTLAGNDESLTVTGEDFDMSMRAYLQRGVTPYFAPDAVYHVARRGGVRPTYRQARNYGRSAVMLYQRYGKGRTDRRAELRRSLKGWAWVIRHVFDLRDPDAAPTWARLAGVRVGRLEQSVRSRTLWP